MIKNQAIVTRAESFSDWYTSIVEAAQLIHYSKIKGFMTFLPRGWAIWEQIQKYLSYKFKELKIQNIALPSLFLYSDFLREKNHVTGFNPELFLITQKGDDQLEDPYVLRPTSEVAFCQLWSETLRTYNQLPFLYNQWCSVFRVEKNTRPFLRNTEFFWHEVHCAFADSNRCNDMVQRMWEVYNWLINDILMMATIKGVKTANERFAGAIDTYTLETIMPDGQALQSSTVHYFGQNFAKTFDVKFQTKNNDFAYVHTMSAGLSTRIIGAMIMSHSDDHGLVLPFKIAPEQIVIIPLLANKNSEILVYAKQIFNKLSNHDQYRILIDESNDSLGAKLSHHETHGVPFVIIVGPNDLTKQTITIKIRTKSEKIQIQNSELINWMKINVNKFDQELYETSQIRLEQTIVKAKTYSEFEQAIKNKKIALSPWHDDVNAENDLKAKTGITTRCIKQDEIINENEKCFYSNKKATHWIYFARAY